MPPVSGRHFVVCRKAPGVRGPEPLSTKIRFGDMCGERSVVYAKHRHSTLMKCGNSKEFPLKENLVFSYFSDFAARESEGREAKSARSKKWFLTTFSTDAKPLRKDLRSGFCPMLFSYCRPSRSSARLLLAAASR